MTALSVTGLAVTWSTAVLLGGCGRPASDTRAHGSAAPIAPVAATSGGPAQARISAAPSAPPADAATTSFDPFPEPENLGPRTFLVLGPFPMSPDGDRKTHSDLDRD